METLFSLSGFADLLAAKLLFEKPGSRGVALLYLGILSTCVVFAAVCSLFADSDFSLVILLLLISQKYYSGKPGEPTSACVQPDFILGA